MPANLLEVRGATRRFGGLVAVDGVSFQVQKNEIFGLIGPNGAGKTTLFNLITGLIPLSSGDLIYQGYSLANYRPHQIAQAGIARTFQNLRLFGELSALENVAIAGNIHNSSNLWTGILGLPVSRREEEKTYKRAEELLDLVGLTDQSNRKACNLAYGDQRRLMNPSEKGSLSQLIRQIRDNLALTVLLIEHHVPLVMGLCDRMAVLDFGKLIALGEPATVRSNPAVIEAYLGDE
ncbi:MAG: ABC transporter ATP-binding protein [Microcystis aeruginosa G11-06]|nr:ABC transporter ATP-binding protein [Microcystis aeruginosa G11-06]